MPCPQRSSEGLPVRIDLLQARLDTGFALLHLAGTQSGRDARRALREARVACREGESRLAGLSDADLRYFRARFADLRQALETPVRPRARVIQMPQQITGAGRALPVAFATTRSRLP